MIWLIVLISAILRFYNLPNLFVFGGDEEHQAILAQSIVEDFHLIWVRVNAGHLGFYLGPYWTYFTSFWLLLSNGHPLITGYAAAAIGVLTTLVIYLVGKALFNQKVAAIASLLYATLPLMVFFDQRYWNPTLVPLLSLLLLYTLFKASKNPHWWIVFAPLYGLIFHIHLSLAPTLLITLPFALRRAVLFNKKVLLLSLAAFTMTVFPLIMFDFFRKGSNISTPFRLQAISEVEENRINPAFHFQALYKTLGRIWYLKPFGDNSDEVLFSCTSEASLALPKEVDRYSQRTKPHFLASLISSLSILTFLVHPQTWRRLSTRILAGFISVIIISFLLFPGSASEYYLLGIFPLILLIPGLIVEYYPKLRPLGLLLILVLSALGIFSVLTNNPQFGLEGKYQLINRISHHLNGRPFEIKQTGSCHHYEGWRYLFKVNGLTPERSQSDLSLGWLYLHEITTKAVLFEVTLSENRVPINFDTTTTIQIKSKGFTGHLRPIN